MTSMCLSSAASAAPGSGVSSTATLAEQRLAWERAVAPHGFERVARCRACYAIRLANACKAASELGFTYISTTLAVSPYQLFDDCSAILERTARACGLVPVTRDWRPLYPQATRESRERGMYRPELLRLSLLGRGGRHRAPRAP